MLTFLSTIHIAIYSIEWMHLNDIRGGLVHTLPCQPPEISDIENQMKTCFFGLKKNIMFTAVGDFPRIFSHWLAVCFFLKFDHIYCFFCWYSATTLRFTHLHTHCWWSCCLQCWAADVSIACRFGQKLLAFLRHRVGASSVLAKQFIAISGLKDYWFFLQIWTNQIEKPFGWYVGRIYTS